MAFLEDDRLFLGRLGESSIAQSVGQIVYRLIDDLNRLLLGRLGNRVSPNLWGKSCIAQSIGWIVCRSGLVGLR